MDKSVEEKILSVLDAYRIMSLATLRPDGWPQATSVGYAHEGLTLYFLCSPESQKAQNLAHDNRVSLTINGDVDQVMQITGVSMAARAEVVTDAGEKQRVLGLLMASYPQQQGMADELPPIEAVHVLRLKPEVISLIDYSKGFGHTDLVTC